MRQGARTRALARSIGRAGAMVGTQSRGESLDNITYVALAIEPGNEASQNDV